MYVHRVLGLCRSMLARDHERQPPLATKDHSDSAWSCTKVQLVVRSIIGVINLAGPHNLIRRRHCQAHLASAVLVQK